MRTAAILLAACACACSSSSAGSGGAGADASVDASAPPEKDATAPESGGSDAESATDATSDATSARDAGTDAGPTEGGGPSDAAPDAPDATGVCSWDASIESAACTSCLTASCCFIVAACENDPACVALDACIDECLSTGGGDAGSVATCEQECNDAQPKQSVRDEWHALNDCLGNQCGANSGAGPCY